jgi:hypothetical protein
MLLDLDQFTARQKDEIIKEIRTGHQMQMTQAEIAQRRLAKENNTQVSTDVDGIGRHVAQFDANGYFTLMHAHKAKGDKDFYKWVLENHPEVRVNAQSRKTQVGYK